METPEFLESPNGRGEPTDIPAPPATSGAVDRETDAPWAPETGAEIMPLVSQSGLGTQVDGSSVDGTPGSSRS